MITNNDSSFVCVEMAIIIVNIFTTSGNGKLSFWSLKSQTPKKENENENETRGIYDR